MCFMQSDGDSSALGGTQGAHAKKRSNLATINSGLLCDDIARKAQAKEGDLPADQHQEEAKRMIMRHIAQQLSERLESAIENLSKQVHLANLFNKLNENKAIQIGCVSLYSAYEVARGSTIIEWVAMC